MTYVCSTENVFGSCFGGVSIILLIVAILTKKRLVLVLKESRDKKMTHQSAKSQIIFLLC
jgi:hypothetical protein